MNNASDTLDGFIECPRSCNIFDNRKLEFVGMGLEDIAKVDCSAFVANCSTDIEASFNYFLVRA